MYHRPIIIILLLVTCASSLSQNTYARTYSKHQTRKVLFFTDITMSHETSLTNIEFASNRSLSFRDAKQFTCLMHCQTRNKEVLSFAFNASLASVNVVSAFARQQGMYLSVGSIKTLLHNAEMLD